MPKGKKKPAARTPAAKTGTKAKRAPRVATPQGKVAIRRPSGGTEPQRMPVRVRKDAPIRPDVLRPALFVGERRLDDERD